MSSISASYLYLSLRVHAAERILALSIQKARREIRHRDPNLRFCVGHFNLCEDLKVRTIPQYHQELIEGNSSFLFRGDTENPFVQGSPTQRQRINFRRYAAVEVPRVQHIEDMDIASHLPDDEIHRESDVPGTESYFSGDDDDGYKSEISEYADATEIPDSYDLDLSLSRQKSHCKMPTSDGAYDIDETEVEDLSTDDMHRIDQPRRHALKQSFTRSFGRRTGQVGLEQQVQLPERIRRCKKCLKQKENEKQLSADDPTKSLSKKRFSKHLHRSINAVVVGSSCFAEGLGRSLVDFP